MSGIMTWIRKWFETSSKKQKLTASLLVVGFLATGVLLTIGGASDTSNDPLGSTPFYFVSVFVKLIAVLLLIVGLSVIYRRWLQFGPNGKTVRQMHLLETVRLSPKQALHLIVIGGQKLLIGATDQNISLITHVEDDLDPAPVEEPQTQSGLDFGSLIQSFNLSSDKLEGKE
jgi:flagellar biosynthetic protein FliO